MKTSNKEVKEKKCPSCGGEKEVRTWIDGEMDISTCGRCNGKGYIILNNMKTLEEIKNWENNFDWYWKQLLGKVVKAEVVKETGEEMKENIKRLLSQTKQELIEEIKFKFGTMVFDNTGEDKTMNIVEFRKEQRDYLNKLLEKLSNK